MTGRFITFEGIDGSGKSTQAVRFAKVLADSGFETLVVRDPGSTKVSESIRELLLNEEYINMSAVTELLLYEAARAQLVQEIIKPALECGKVVICDRFYDSTTAYQGYARQLNMTIVDRANQIGSCGLVPDLTFYIDMKPQDTLKRIKKDNLKSDRMEAEGLSFQSKVRFGYLEIAELYPQRFMIIDGNDTIANVHKQIIKLWNITNEHK